MKRVIIAGSPRSNGRSAHLAEMLFEASIDERPEDEVYLIPVSELEINPCIACGGCRAETSYEFEDENGEQQTASAHLCVLDDEMSEVYPLINAADELIIVAPVFFSGASASLKALLDRLQPYFWENTRKKPKRPATLHVIGEGGDPHGYGALVSEVRSATAVAGFRLERVLDWVGKIDESGEITAEADVVEDSTAPLPVAKEEAAAKPAQQKAAASAQRPKLNLSSNAQSQRSSKQGAAQGSTQGGRAKQQGKQGRQAQQAKQTKQTKQTKQAGQNRQSKQQGKGKRRG